MSTVIVIDDNPSITEIISIALKDEGHQVFSFHDGVSALPNILEIKPKVIFLDIFMPFKCGFILIKELKQLVPNSLIVAITGGFQTFDSESCMIIAKKMGAQRSLTKPFEIEEVISIVNNLEP